MPTLDQLGCTHEFVYAGVRFQIKDRNLPGSGARPVYYYDYYYCQKCLQGKAVELNAQTNTYEPIQFDATPLPSGVKVG